MESETDEIVLTSEDVTDEEVVNWDDIYGVLPDGEGDNAVSTEEIIIAADDESNSTSGEPPMDDEFLDYEMPWVAEEEI